MYIAESADDIYSIVQRPQVGRGINVYSFAELFGVLARKKDGGKETAVHQLPLFSLSLDERIEVFKRCSPVFGVVTSRMNRISGLNYTVVPDKKNEDKIADYLKNCCAVYREYEGRGEFKYMIARAALRKEIMSELPDVLPDLSNFGAALLRWKRRLQAMKADHAQEIEDWLAQPNINDSWADYAKNGFLI